MFIVVDVIIKAMSLKIMHLSKLLFLTIILWIDKILQDSECCLLRLNNMTKVARVDLNQ